MIYSISNSAQCLFKSKYCTTDPTLKANGTIYYYDRSDWGGRGILFENMLPQKLWDHFKKDTSTKILINYFDDFICKVDIVHIANTIKNKRLDANRIFLIVPDSNYLKFATKAFNKLGVDIHIQDYNGALKKILLMNVSIHSRFPVKRFSMLSRNYRDIRLKFYATLKQQNLLSKFSYTFNNIDPYVQPNKIFDHFYIREKLTEFGFDLNDELNTWVDRIPYVAGNVQNKIDNEIYNLIDKTGVHIIVESHFDHFVNYYGPRCSYIEYAPPFITEKTYKPISRSKPFIFFAAPYSLQALRDLGFKTFDPLIDESYDQIENDEDRLEALVKEISRISSMSKKEFGRLIDVTRDITDYNFNHLIKLKQNITLNGNFEWILPLMNN